LGHTTKTERDRTEANGGDGVGGKKVFPVDWCRAKPRWALRVCGMIRMGEGFVVALKIGRVWGNMVADQGRIMGRANDKNRITVEDIGSSGRVTKI